LLALKEKILSFKNSHEITKILFYSDSRYSIKTLEENADDLIFKAREIKLKLMGEENQLQVKIDFPYQLEDRLQRSI
jgi:hypothetical protein